MTITINKLGKRERVRGKLQKHERLDEWTLLLKSAGEAAADPWRSTVLLHHPPPDLRPGGELQKAQQDKINTIIAGKAKRYVLSVEMSSGLRIVKFFEPRSLGNHLGGLLHQSTSQREHFNQLRAESLGTAATTTLGYLELYQNHRLVRAAQVQEPVNPTSCLPFNDFFPAEFKRFSDEAIPPLARAMGRMHSRRFFHNDLKSFHAYVRPHTPDQSRHHPTEYDLLWIDLAGAGFRLTKRQRVINLYQALRYLLPPNDHLHTHFLRVYCEATRWHQHTPERAIKTVKSFLNYKLRTHPQP